MPFVIAYPIALGVVLLATVVYFEVSAMRGFRPWPRKAGITCLVVLAVVLVSIMGTAEYPARRT